MRNMNYLGNKYTGDLSELEERNVKISKVKNNWVIGTYKDLWFEAKVYCEPSKYGIRKGRTSKLHIKQGKNTIFEYDRGYYMRAKITNVKKLVSIFSTGSFGKKSKVRC